jgi:CheY-specific phosphatase CheX
MTESIPVVLDVSIVERFREVVVNQLLDTVGLAVTASSEQIADPPGIAVVIEFSGDLTGPIIWVFPTTLALELVRRLMGDPDPSPELAADGATELANILTGRASEIFEQYGVHCQFGVPRIHEGALPPGTVVQLATDAGCVDLMLSMLYQRSLTRN